MDGESQCSQRQVEKTAGPTERQLKAMAVLCLFAIILNFPPVSDAGPVRVGRAAAPNFEEADVTTPSVTGTGNNASVVTGKPPSPAVVCPPGMGNHMGICVNCTQHYNYSTTYDPSPCQPCTGWNDGCDQTHHWCTVVSDYYCGSCQLQEHRNNKGICQNCRKCPKGTYQANGCFDYTEVICLPVPVPSTMQPPANTTQTTPETTVAVTMTPNNGTNQQPSTGTDPPLITTNEVMVNTSVPSAPRTVSLATGPATPDSSAPEQAITSSSASVSPIVTPETGAIRDMSKSSDGVVWIIPTAVFVCLGIFYTVLFVYHRHLKRTVWKPKDKTNRNGIPAITENGGGKVMSSAREERSETSRPPADLQRGRSTSF